MLINIWCRNTKALAEGRGQKMELWVKHNLMLSGDFQIVLKLSVW
jgi:hypothetical protein